MPKRRADQVFLNVPFDERYAPLYVAIIASLTALGMTPRSVLEVQPYDKARLARLMTIIHACGASIHDLSRVELSDGVPRFNMPFELGVTLGVHQNAGHRWFVFESVRHRVTRSLSDIGGYDAVQIHGESVKGVMRAVSDAFRSNKRPVTLDDFDALCSITYDGGALTAIRQAARVTATSSTSCTRRPRRGCSSRCSRGSS